MYTEKETAVTFVAIAALFVGAITFTAVSTALNAK